MRGNKEDTLRDLIEAAIMESDVAEGLRLAADPALTSGDLEDNFGNACGNGMLELAKAMYATGKVTAAQVDGAAGWPEILLNGPLLNWLLALKPDPGALEQAMYSSLDQSEQLEDEVALDEWLDTHRRLMEWGVSPREATVGTLLAIALETGRAEFSGYLLAKGIPLAHARALTGQVPMPKARDALDKIPMRDATEKQAMLAGALQAVDVRRVALALEAGANPNVAYPEVDWRDDFLPLATAAREKSLECVELLLHAGARVNAANGVALAIAAKSGADEVLRALISAGADLDANGSAALAAAAGQGEISCMELLIAAGADIDAGNQLAFRAAEDAQQSKAVEWLRARGAIEPKLATLSADFAIERADLAELWRAWIEIVDANMLDDDPRAKSAPGLTERALDKLASALSGNLPSELRVLYRAPYKRRRYFSSYEWSSPETLTRDWQLIRDLAAQHDNGFGYTSTPPGAIATVYANAGWVPFANDGCGNFLALDLAAGPAGKVGQVINCGRDEEAKYVMAPNLAELLRRMLRAYRADGVRRYEDTLWFGDREEPFARELFSAMTQGLGKPTA